MNREIYNKIREFSVDMYTQGFSDGYTDGSTRGCEVEKAQEYKRGFENGCSQGWEEAYKKGLNDAWEVARKITNDMPIPELESRELSVDDCEDEYEYSCKVIKMYSASEVIDKLKGHTTKPEHSTPINSCANCQNTPPINRCATCTHKGELKEYCSDCISYYNYEEMCCDNCALNLTECTDLGPFCGYKKWKPKQDESISDECVDDEIRVGDEVIIHENDKGIVISISYNGGCFKILSEDGRWGSLIYNKNDITKTGRHFPHIAKIFNK